MARKRETHYAKGPGGDIAYQVVGDGPIDLVVVPGWISHVDLMWAASGWTRFNEELASFARVIFYDKLGTGLSDPIVELPTHREPRRRITRGVGCRRQRSTGVVRHLHGRTDQCDVRGELPGASRGPGLVRELHERVASTTMALRLGAAWIEADEAGSDVGRPLGRGHDDRLGSTQYQFSARYREVLGGFERASMSPRMALLLWQAHLRLIDVRDVLSSVHVPTLVLHRKDEAIPVEFARELATGIPGARLVELDGVDHMPWSVTSLRSPARLRSSSRVSGTSRRRTAYLRR